VVENDKVYPVDPDLDLTFDNLSKPINVGKWGNVLAYDKLAPSRMRPFVRYVAITDAAV
jgi:hypothetical protein